MLDFEENFYFDENLRECPKDPKKVKNYIVSVEKKILEDETQEDVVRHLGEIGALYRSLGELRFAEKNLEQAIEIIKANQLSPRFYLINAARLAHVWQWQKRFDESTPLFESLVAMCEEDEQLLGLRGTIYQHAGKNLFDQGRYGEALEFFEKAMELRRASDDLGLIESTQFAIDTTRSHLLK